MVSSICSSCPYDSISLYSVSDSPVSNSADSTTFDIAEYLSDSIESQDEGDSSSEVSASDLAKSLKGISTCPHCGAIYMGSCMSACARCGEDMSESNKNEKSRESDSTTADASGDIASVNCEDSASQEGVNSVASTNISQIVAPTIAL